jgi:hypothetical protein
VKNSLEISRFGINQLKHKKKKWIKLFIIGIVIIALLAFASVKCEEMIRCNISKLSVNNDANAIWIGSLASYWGAIIGGIFSGIIAVFGVFYTIRFTRDTDRKKERQSIQPFLNVEIVGKSSETIKIIQIADESEYVDEKSIQEFCPIYLSITNIGNGFANTLTFGTGENLTGVSFKEVFTVNQKKEILLNVQTYKIQKGIKFFIWYADSVTNEYVQYYELKQNVNGTGFYLDVGYPEVIE